MLLFFSKKYTFKYEPLYICYYIPGKYIKQLKIYNLHKL